MLQHCYYSHSCYTLTRLHLLPFSLPLSLIFICYPSLYQSLHLFVVATVQCITRHSTAVVLFFLPPPVSPPNRRGGGGGGGDVGVGALPSSATLLHPLLSYSHLSLPGGQFLICYSPSSSPAVLPPVSPRVLGRHCITRNIPSSSAATRVPVSLPLRCCYCILSSLPTCVLSSPLPRLPYSHLSPHLPVVVAVTPAGLISHLCIVLATTSPVIPVYPICRSCPCSSHYHLSLSPPVFCPRHYPTYHTPTCLSACLLSPLHRLLHSLVFNCHPSICLSASLLLPLHPLHSPHLCVVLATTTPVTLPSVSPLVCGHHCITCYTPSSSAATHLPVSPPVRCCLCIPSIPPICALSSTLYTPYSHLSLHLSVVAVVLTATLPPVCYCLPPSVGGRFCTDC